MPRITDVSKNLAAFLDLIAWSEGTSTIEESDDGYNVLVGGKLFDSYADHPRQKISIPNLHLYSTAAGRYQFVARTWDSCKMFLKLSDFSPESQDHAAVLLVRGRGAIDDIEAGRIEDAIKKCCNEWASFPGNNYKQGPHPLVKLMAKYTDLMGVGA